VSEWLMPPSALLVALRCSASPMDGRLEGGDYGGAIFGVPRKRGLITLCGLSLLSRI
jgi:hypothetical protein